MRGVCSTRTFIVGGLTFVALPLISIDGPAAGRPQQPAARNQQQTQDVIYDHREGEQAAYTLYPQNGSVFFITILNTCPAQFVYEVLGIGEEAAPPVAPTADMRTDSTSRLSDVTLSVVHDDSYGGYYVDIRLSDHPERQQVACTDTQHTDGTTSGVELAPTKLVITTPNRSWQTRVAGAYTVSTLTPVCANDEGCGDQVNQGLATFLHTYHERFPSVAPMFGLGISGDNRAEYYFGGGIRLNDEVAFSGGMVFGPRQVETKTRTRFGWFFGVSYTILDTANAIQQPFAGAGTEQ